MAEIRHTHMKVVCPTAPTIPVTLNAGFRMPSWFDLKTLDIGGPEDEDGIKKASKNVHEMIQSEIQVIYFVIQMNNLLLNYIFFVLGWYPCK